MASTNFRVFNEANAPANTYNDSEYQNATQRQTGVIPGMAISRMHNKMYFQWSSMATAIAQYLVSRGYDCNDDDLSGIVSALENSCGLNIRQDSTAYAVGDIAYSAALSSVLFLECTTAGTTASSIPAALTGAAEGDSITDGTVVWIVRKIASMADVRAASPGQRQASTAYAVDDMASLGSLPYGWYLLCTTAGTTSASALVISTPAVGDTVTDGTVVWTIKKISSSDGVPVGAMLPYSANGDIPSGYLLCDGSAVSRTMYPDLFTCIGTTYGAGDGSTTFNVPDYNTAKRFVQGDTVAGTVIAAGLPNITGDPGFIEQAPNSEFSDTGAYYGIARAGSNVSYTTSSSSTTKLYTAHFDAARSSSAYGNSDTVQPPALTARFIIKAFDGQTADSALIDITQYASELANKATRALDNLSADGENHFLEQDFTIIYPNGGSEASPANITINNRYLESNPFPGYYVACLVEFLISGEWGGPGGWVYGQGSSGTNASQFNDDSIAVVTGTSTVFINRAYSGNAFDLNQQFTSLPARVKVWKIGKIPD